MCSSARASVSEKQGATLHLAALSCEMYLVLIDADITSMSFMPRDVANASNMLVVASVLPGVSHGAMFLRQVCICTGSG